MNTSAQQLADHLATALKGSQTATGGPWLWRPLLHLLATGRPVTTDQLAAAAGRTEDEVRRALAAMPDTECDEGGRVGGASLTQRPTPHRYETGGTQLYTWCALDTLVFPAVLGATARIESPCHATGTPVRLTVTPDGVTALTPPDAVVSLVTPDEGKSVRASFCDEVHFFASPEAAQGWLTGHPGMTVLPVADAHRLGRPLADILLNRAGPTEHC